MVQPPCSTGSAKGELVPQTAHQSRCVELRCALRVLLCIGHGGFALEAYKQVHAMIFPDLPEPRDLVTPTMFAESCQSLAVPGILHDVMSASWA